MPAAPELDRRTFLRRSAAFAAAGGLLGCAPRDRVETVKHPGSSGSDTVFILLPGFRDHAEDFSDYGLVEEIQSTTGADVIATDTTMAYYQSGKVPDFVGRDIVAPAAERYKQVWLLGISMGGLGCTLVGREYEQAITGVVMIAPFLGRKAIHQEIQEAGGLASWRPKVDTTEVGRGNFEAATWEWLSGYATGQDRPALYLGAGTEDQGPGYDLLASALPQERVFEAPGGHKWATWAKLWPDMIAAAQGVMVAEAATAAA